MSVDAVSSSCSYISTGLQGIVDAAESGGLRGASFNASNGMVDSKASRMGRIARKFSICRSSEAEKAKELLTTMKARIPEGEAFHHEAIQRCMDRLDVLGKQRGAQFLHGAYANSVEACLREALRELRVADRTPFQEAMRAAEEAPKPFDQLMGKEFAPQTNNAIYILKPDADALNEYCKAVLAGDTPPKISSNLKAALLKCRYLDLDNWNQATVSSDVVRQVLKRPEIQRFLLKQEEVILMKELRLGSPKHVLALVEKLQVAKRNGTEDAFVASLSKKDFEAIARFQDNADKFDALLSRFVALKGQKEVVGLHSNTLSRLFEAHYALRGLVSENVILEKKVSQAINEVHLEKTTEAIISELKHLPYSRKMELKDAFSKGDISGSNLSPSVLADLMLLKPLIIKQADAKALCPEFEGENLFKGNLQFMNTVVTHLDQILDEYDAFPQTLVSPRFTDEKSVHQHLSVLAQGVERNLSMIPKEDQDGVRHMLAELAKDGEVPVDPKLLKYALMLKPYADAYAKIQDKQSEAFSTYDQKPSLDILKGLSGAITLIQAQESSVKTEIMKSKDQAITELNERRQKVETVLNSRLLAAYVRAWCLPVALAKLDVEQDIENVLIKAFENLQKELMGGNKVEKVFVPAIEGLADAATNLGSDEYKAKVEALGKSEAMEKDAWGVSKYTDKYFAQFTNPMIKKMFPPKGDVTGAVIESIKQRKTRGFKELFLKKVKTTGLKLFGTAGVRKLVSNQLQLELGRDPIKDIINKSLSTVLMSVVDSLSHPSFVNMQIDHGLRAYMASEGGGGELDASIPLDAEAPVRQMISNFLQLGFPTTGSTASSVIEYFSGASNYVVQGIRNASEIRPSAMVYLLQSLRGTLYDYDSYDELPGGRVLSLLDEAHLHDDARDTVNDVVGSFFKLRSVTIEPITTTATAAREAERSEREEAQATVAPVQSIQRTWRDMLYNAAAYAASSVASATTTVARTARDAGSAVASGVRERLIDAGELALRATVKPFAQSGAVDIFESLQSHERNRMLVMHALESIMRGMELYDHDATLERPYTLRPLRTPEVDVDDDAGPLIEDAGPLIEDVD